jgi:hypothetical protein
MVVPPKTPIKLELRLLSSPDLLSPDLVLGLSYLSPLLTNKTNEAFAFNAHGLVLANLSLQSLQLSGEIELAVFAAHGLNRFVDFFEALRAKHITEYLKRRATGEKKEHYPADCTSHLHNCRYFII